MKHCALCGSDDRICNDPRCPHAPEPTQDGSGLAKWWAESARPDFLLGKLQRYSHDDTKNVMKPNWSGEFVQYEEVQKIIAEATRVIRTVSEGR